VKRLGLAFLVVAALAGPALAEDVVTYRAAGTAPDGPDASDDQGARTAALDEAFKAATRAAVEEQTSPEARAGAADAIDREVVKRARLWVSSFKVTKQSTRDGVLALDVDVRIDVAKLRARLVELNVAVGGGAGATTQEPAPSTRSATLLLRVTTIEGALATFGIGQSTNVPGADGAEAALRRAGLATVPAPGSGPAAKAGDGLPLSDDAARALAGDANARIVVIAGVDQSAPGRVRGARTVGGLARAQVRILDTDGGGRLLGQARAVRGASGQGAAQVAEAATRAALLDAIDQALPRERRDVPEAGPVRDLPKARDGEVLVRIRGGTGAQVAAIQAYLASAQGTKGVALRRLAGGETVLGIRGLRAERIGALVRGASELVAKARIEGGAVEITVGGS
jgi:hypothetical protein